jgi:NRPS condensation-like uncharacterized protein
VKSSARHLEEETTRPFWLRLDNAAKIYPAIQSRELTAVFRISVVLTRPVVAKTLLNAIKLLEQRFPYYKVKPKTGFFWHYLEYYNSPTPVKADTDVPCRVFTNNDLLFRVLARNNTISVEFSHILTDATGGFEFLKSLLLTYFEITGVAISRTLPFHRPGQVPSEKEFEDSYNKYFRQEIPTPKKITKAFHLPFKLNTIPRFKVVTGIVSLEQISKKSKTYGVSITVYLVAIYLHALQGIYHSMSFLRRRRSKKIIRIEVPVNLRKVYPSETMRNFSVFVLPGIDLELGDYTFEEIVKTVYHMMQLETDRKLINKVISRNVGAERNVLVKNIPLVIKSLILYFKYKSSGTNLYSGVITNLGKISLPPEVNDLIDHFVFIPPPPDKTLKVNCGVAGFGNKLVLSFGNITRSRELEQRFFKTLVAHGISVKMIHY